MATVESLKKPEDLRAAPMLHPEYLPVTSFKMCRGLHFCVFAFKASRSIIEGYITLYDPILQAYDCPI